MKQKKKMTRNSSHHLQSMKSQKADQKQVNTGRIVAKTSISLNLSEEKNHISLCPW